MSTSFHASDATEKNKVEGGVLYLVSTPIGNLSDLSPRAIKVLTEVDFIAAEDTRNSGKLLSLFGIKRPLFSYHEHNRKMRGEEIVSRLLGGESCAIVTDAGTPAISDPGEDIVRLCAERGIRVTAIPGACAAITALSLSALATGRFAFEGFLPTASGERKRRLDALCRETRTMILYEAPHRLTDTLSTLYSSLGNRKIAVCRELTKLNEEIIHSTLAAVTEFYKTTSPRGEYVLVIEGAPEESADISAEILALSPEEHVQKHMDAGLSRMDALKLAAKERGMKKNELYKLLYHE